jgi:hypothetical protein
VDHVCGIGYLNDYQCVESAQCKDFTNVTMTTEILRRLYMEGVYIKVNKVDNDTKMSCCDTDRCNGYVKPLVKCVQSDNGTVVRYECKPFGEGITPIMPPICRQTAQQMKCAVLQHTPHSNNDVYTKMNA